MNKLTWYLNGNIKEVTSIIQEAVNKYGNITVKEFIELQIEESN